MVATDSAARQWRQFHQQFYESGAWISDEVNAAVTDAAYSRPTGSMIPMLHHVDETERRRIVAAVIRELAKEHGVSRRMMKLCYDYFLAVGRLRKAIGARKAELLVSYRCQLGIRKVIILSRRSVKSIIRKLESVKHQSP